MILLRVSNIYDLIIIRDFQILADRRFVTNTNNSVLLGFNLVLNLIIIRFQQTLRLFQLYHNLYLQKV